jgi:hypothetical protein
MSTILDRITHSAITIAAFVIATFSFLPWVSGVALGVIFIMLMNRAFHIAVLAAATRHATDKPQEVVMIPHPMLIECFSNATLMKQREQEKKEQSNSTTTQGDSNGSGTNAKDS